ncbi:MAG: hypothetical protein HQ501_01980, partial [Rhodospirillales bacterium]|nr:hypothetical protein [Rhodospirillales bacterium]
LMVELDYQPTNKYLPPRPRRQGQPDKAAVSPLLSAVTPKENPVLHWIDRVLSR